jgi:hypothetical protein
MKVTVASAVSLAFAGLVAACASSFPPPNDEWAAAQADVGRAQAGGAPAVPDARLHLQLAVEDLQKSKALIGNDNQRAYTLTEVARSEAQLALSLSKEAEAEGQASRTQAEVSRAAAK